MDSSELEYVYNPVFKSIDIDSVDLNTQNNIQLIQMDITKNQQEQDNYISQKNSVLKILEQVEVDLLSTDLAIKEKAVKEYNKVKSDYQNLKPPINQNNSLQLRLSFLQSRLHIKKSQSISGYISYFTIN